MMRVKLRGFGAVMRGMSAMARRGVGMMRGGFGLLVFIVLGGHAVMMRRFLVMLGGGVMMGAGRMFVRHGKLLVAQPQAHRSPAKQTCQGALFFANFAGAARCSHQTVARPPFNRCGSWGTSKWPISRFRQKPI